MGYRSLSSGPFVFLMVLVLSLSGCIGIIHHGIGSDDATMETIVNSSSLDETGYQTTAGEFTPTRTTEGKSTLTTSSPCGPMSECTVTATATDIPTATEIPTNDGKSTDIETPTSPPTPAPLTLTVAIRGEDEVISQRTSQIRTVLTYWEQNSEQYVGQPVEFRLVSDAENPDVVISYVSHIERCGDQTKRIAGCTRRGAQSVRVQIVSHYTDNSSVLILKHEFGHVLGLGHNDAPSEIMSTPLKIYSPDATDRDFAWDHSTLTVAIDLSTVPSDERAATKQEIREVLAYYDAGAGGTVPESVSFRLVSNPETADITIRSSPTSPCSNIDPDVGGSCHRMVGEHYDSDSAPETYTHLEIVLTNLGTEAIKTHIGFQLGFAFGFEELGDWPELFRPETVG